MEATEVSPEEAVPTFLLMEKKAKEFVISAIEEELNANPHGVFATRLANAMDLHMRGLLRRQLPEVRISFKGEVASW